MKTRLTFIWAAVTALLLSSCTLPFPATPTPFTFPTPNQTLTAIYAPTSTVTLAPPTLPPIESTASPTPELAIEAAETDEAETLPIGSPYPTDSIMRTNGDPIYASYLIKTPTIDGDLDDWGTLPESASINTFGSSYWSGTSDLSAGFKLLWDGDYLYLAVAVTDDIHSQTHSGYYIYEGDEVEIMLDANLESDFNTNALNSDDYQIGLSPGDFSSLSPEYYRFFPSGYGAYPSGVVVKAVQTASGYNLEAKIPWSAFGISDPYIGSHYGFALGVSDSDVSGTSDQQSMTSIVSGYRLTRPGTWGTLILKDTRGQ
ncbi:MAG: hypothetical protein JXA25_05475 [Anaerolineales bacterium]|nr:hypothetical protein [Anaerolineales bacterium]